jgi:hypothetical protein
VVRREGDVLKVQNALGAPLQSGYLRLGKKGYWLPEIADGAEAVAREDAPSSGSSKESLEQQEKNIQIVMGPPVQLKRRVTKVEGGFQRPLEEGGFVARLGGSGYGPLAGMKVELHEGLHFVRGQVDTP